MHDSTTRNAAVIVQLMNQALAAPDVPNAVTPLLQRLVSDTAAVGAGYFQRDGHLFHARAASGDMPDDEQFTALLAHGLPEDLPLLAQLKERSEPLFFSDTAADGRVEAFASFGVKSLAAAPVHSTGGDFLGSFLMHTFEQHRWNEGESALFASLAGALAGLTARLIAEEDAKSAREGAMRALGLALEARDRETKGHTDRVTNLAVRLAGLLDLPQEEITAIRWGAYLHDIGKISVPDAILLKPGSLTDEEWTVMRNHTVVGHQFASELGFLPELSLGLVRHHHERWDGNGYPDRLSRSNVPISARLFAACDVYDALTSERPYKKAWSADQALAEIHAQREKHFAPDVVDVFERALES
jgi:putative nucleotidyltransferase with HDIG domain